MGAGRAPTVALELWARHRRVVDDFGVPLSAQVSGGLEPRGGLLPVGRYVHVNVSLALPPTHNGADRLLVLTTRLTCGGEQKAQNGRPLLCAERGHQPLNFGVFFENKSQTFFALLLSATLHDFASMGGSQFDSGRIFINRQSAVSSQSR